MRRAFLLSLFASLTVAAAAQPPLPTPSAAKHQWVNVTTITHHDVLFQVSATSVTTPPAQGVYAFWDCYNDPSKPTALVAIAGIDPPTVTSPPDCPPVSLSGPGKRYQWTALDGPLHIGTINALSIDAASVNGNIVFYPQLAANFWADIPLTNVRSVVRSDSFCAAGLNCNGPSPAPSGPITTSSAPLPPPVITQPGTCSTTRAYGYPIMQTSKNLWFGRKRYTAVLPLWPPIDNELECSVRQLFVNIPNDLRDELGLTGSKGTQVTLRVFPNKHQPPDATSPLPSMEIYGLDRGKNSDLTLISFNAQAYDSQLGAEQTKGNYCVEIVVQGHRQPLTNYSTGKPEPQPLPPQPANPTDCQ